jgi:hypothetical protein
MSNEKKLAVYFGRIGPTGHCLHGIRSSWKTPDAFPWPLPYLDGGFLEENNIPDRVTGNVFWTAREATDKTSLWFGFAWWDRSGDSRGNSNSGFYVRWPEAVSVDDIFVVAQQAFAHACEMWPEVVSRQEFPLQLMLLLTYRPPGE